MFMRATSGGRRGILLVLIVLCYVLSFCAFREFYNSAGMAMLAPGYRPPPVKLDAAKLWTLFAGTSSFLLAGLMLYWRKFGSR